MGVTPEMESFAGAPAMVDTVRAPEVKLVRVAVTVEDSTALSLK